MYSSQSPLTPSRRQPRCSWWMNSLVAMATQPALGERQAARGQGGEREEGGDWSLALLGTKYWVDTEHVLSVNTCMS